MRKPAIITVIAFLTIALTACTTVDYSVNAAGASDYTTLVVKDFVSLGIITVHATETHHSSPFGLSKTLSGSKITFTDLLQEAAKLEADDIINVRVDMTINYEKNLFDWVTGWTKIYTYTGTALAIKYTDKAEVQYADPQLGGLPRAPEPTGIIQTSPSGKPMFR